MNLRGNLQDALGFAGLRYITFAQSSVPGQQISISSSENFSDPKCIFKMSSDAIKNAENRLRESALHDDVQIDGFAVCFIFCYDKGILRYGFELRQYKKLESE